MQQITPFLWFENQAEAAVGFHTSIFKQSQILNVARFMQALLQMKKPDIKKLKAVTKRKEQA